ncbi:MAG: NADH-quinone oxidoreductase subunit C [Gammaproteobacteria bacterium]|nr:NADH-quinone oxidoreductase subunit C [Gammaproteobacteria bacterium]
MVLFNCRIKFTEKVSLNAKPPEPLTQLQQQLTEHFPEGINRATLAKNELTVEVAPEWLKPICEVLRDNSVFRFDMLIDICGVDYLDYGVSEWRGEETTATGFDRGVDRQCRQREIPWHNARFASVYHLLSTHFNRRLRLRTAVPDSTMTIDSIVEIWPAANWYEREAFDLFGILYDGHPDLRRLLTDYGFIGHPLRKDFPLSGHVEVRYDAETQRVIYEPVDIEPRVLVPKVIRQDNRYAADSNEQGEENGAD